MEKSEVRKVVLNLRTLFYSDFLKCTTVSTPFFGQSKVDFSTLTTTTTTTTTRKWECGKLLAVG